MAILVVSPATLARLRRALSPARITGAGMAQVSSSDAGTIVYVPPATRMVDGGATTPLRLVRVQQDGGSAGSDTVACSYTYAIWPATGQFGGDASRLATQLAPAYRPVRPAAYVAASAQSYALAAYVDGAWVLLQAFGEYIAGDPCPA